MNRLTHLLLLAGALTLSGCGGTVEQTTGTPPASSAASPTPTAITTAAAPANADLTPTTAQTPGAETAPPGASSTPAPRAAAQPSKAPKPQIGSGGNDLFLFTQARAAVNNDADLKAANVVIDVKEGVLTLSGTVASAALKSKAEQLARGAGAKEVKNQLRVNAGR